MNIKSWTLDKIMALPDWCFGQRWWVGTYVGSNNDDIGYWTIEDHLPDTFVIWQMLVNGSAWETGTGINMAVRLASAGEDTDGFWKSPRLFHQIAKETMAHEFFLTTLTHFLLVNCRTVHESRGLRICGSFKILNQSGDSENMVAFLISSIPKEVPDWVVSGLAGVR